MIGQLKGQIISKQSPQIVLDVQGVGYEVDVPSNVLDRLPDIGQTVILHTHYIVREDAHLLYGFDRIEERSLFRLLLKVNGVGPKLALTILSHLSTHQFIESVMHNQLTRLTQISGVGKKTAERIMIEMRDKLSTWALGPQTVKLPSNRQMAEDAIAALMALGYKSQDAHAAVSKIESLYATSEEMIRHVLKERVV